MIFRRRFIALATPSLACILLAAREFEIADFEPVLLVSRRRSAPRALSIYAPSRSPRKPKLYISPPFCHCRSTVSSHCTSFTTAPSHPSPSPLPVVEKPKLEISTPFYCPRDPFTRPHPSLRFVTDAAPFHDNVLPVLHLSTPHHSRLLAAPKWKLYILPPFYHCRNTSSPHFTPFTFTVLSYSRARPLCPFLRLKSRNLKCRRRFILLTIVLNSICSPLFGTPRHATPYPRCAFWQRQRSRLDISRPFYRCHGAIHVHRICGS